MEESVQRLGQKEERAPLTEEADRIADMELFLGVNWNSTMQNCPFHVFSLSVVKHEDITVRLFVLWDKNADRCRDTSLAILK